MELFRRIEIFRGERLTFGKDLVIRNDKDGKGEYIDKWFLPGFPPALKDIPNYTEQDYINAFGANSVKTLLQRIEDLESRVSVLEGKK